MKTTTVLATAFLVTAVATTILVNIKKEQASRPVEKCTLHFNGTTIADVPQVKTTVQMERGLSGLKDVGNGMLFTWPDEALRVFWMHETPIPLSVAFIDSEGVVLQIENMQPESDFMHWSTHPAREGLEMRMGDFERLGIMPGSKLSTRECGPI